VLPKALKYTQMDSRCLVLSEPSMMINPLYELQSTSSLPMIPDYAASSNDNVSRFEVRGGVDEKEESV